MWKHPSCTTKWLKSVYKYLFLNQLTLILILYIKIIILPFVYIALTVPIEVSHSRIVLPAVVEVSGHQVDVYGRDGTLGLYSVHVHVGYVLGQS